VGGAEVYFDEGTVIKIVRRTLNDNKYTIIFEHGDHEYTAWFYVQ